MKILVRGTNWIGDAVMSVPALRELRRIFPDDSITLHTRTWADGLFRDADFLDEIVTYDPAKWRFRDVLDNSNFLKKDAFDLAIILPNSFESAMTSFLTRIPRRIGYNKDLRGLLLTDPIAVPEWKSRRHEVFYYLNLVSEIEKRVIGRNTVGQLAPNISIDVSPERRKAARQIIADATSDSRGPIVALGVGSTNSRAKRWPAARYAQLATKLKQELDASIILVGSAEDSVVAKEVADLSGVQTVDLSGKTTIAEAVAILAEVDILVSNDMGLAHIAPAVGTRTVVIFGPTNPTTTRPYSNDADIVKYDVECSPCTFRDCPIDHRCMTNVSVEVVAERVSVALQPDENEQTIQAGDIC
ncbi:MAG TPA: lipopolysaccharide heptosyltransferase II [Pyrinomonadaceae bacterium]|nr:lipopolysaccharide heptosyltransferase II [Chloracidobacterium sp.]HQX55094.1 lipopolysaccharide heptosyltransferase II [Pyrinomonadaceae bacterium]MBK7802526.1 lipopolysaccharide heptosyltransferase II [Chloracidobacterium sp.]MBK9437380.1 lipopolysaccharide heptosyltransferase II [Chloracidobacterium sp.]MBL0240053.1 lipopolysaccharide heptosyltransferase II [Chloracidobacterium sp.]